MTNDTIHIEEEVTGTARRWTEQISVRGGDLRETLGRLGKEATVRKITVKSESGKTLVEFPLLLGAAGVLIIGPWTAALLAAAWLTRVSILIEYEASAVEQMKGAAGELADKVEAAVA